MKLWEKHRLSAPRLAPRHGFVNSEVTSPSLPRKEFREKNRRGSPGALPARRSRVAQALVFASHLAGGNGEAAAIRLGGEVASSSLPEKESQEKTEQSAYVLYR